MIHSFSLRSTTKAVLVLISATALVHTVSTQAADKAKDKKAGTYVTGDFHNHTTCSDGSLSLQKLVEKSTDSKKGRYNLDWYIQTDHGGSYTRNCTIIEDPFEPNTPALNLTTITNASTISGTGVVSGAFTGQAASTSVNPYPSAGQPTTGNKGPNQTWTALSVTPKGTGQTAGTMWRWQNIKEYQYKTLETESRNRKKPIWVGNELNPAGHEHVQVTVLDGQATWPSMAANGNADLLAQHEYCFDRNDTDPSRGAENNWDCSVTGSANNSLIDATAKKILGSNGTTSPNAPNKGHIKSVEGVKWLKEKALNTSFYIPAHIERAGKYMIENSSGGTDIEHFREYNNIAPTIAFGFESMPGHQASAQRGEYSVDRNNGTNNTGSAAGGRTYGGTGGYAAIVGGVWDALLGEGRNWWFFASSDWHNRGIFGPEQLESTLDFYPGEYTNMSVMSRKGSDNLTAQTVLDGLRTGNVWVANGGLIDKMSFVVCRYNPTMPRAAFQALIEKASLTAAQSGKEVRIDGCATMGEKLKARKDTDLLVTVVVRNPKANYSPYSFPNPSLAQINITQALDKPVLDHVDVIWGQVTQAPLATQEVTNPCVKSSYFSCGDLTSAAAKNTTTIMAKRFNSANWKDSGSNYITMSYKVSAGSKSQYFRLRGTNLPVSTPNETDADGNPLTDDTSVAYKIPCTNAACPPHLNNTNGVKYSSYDVAGWADLWFYSNPVFVEIQSDLKLLAIK